MATSSGGEFSDREGDDDRHECYCDECKQPCRNPAACTCRKDPSTCGAVCSACYDDRHMGFA